MSNENKPVVNRNNTPDKNEGLKKFITAIVGPLVDKVSEEADKMEEEGKKVDFSSIGELLQRSMPEQMKGMLGMAPGDKKKKIELPFNNKKNTDETASGD